MLEVVEFKEIDTDERAGKWYELRNGKDRVARVWDSTEEKTTNLIWEGNLAFSRLEETAIDELSKIVSNNISPMTLDDPINRPLVRVVLLGRHLGFKDESGKNSDGRLLADLSDFQEYRHYLSDPNKIGWVRYDVEAPQLNYTFIACNPEYRDENGRDWGRELNLVLNKEYHWNEKTAEWIIRHHFEGDRLASKVSATDIVTIMNQIIP